MEENLTLHAMSWTAFRCASGYREELDLLEQKLVVVLSTLEKASKRSAKLGSRCKELKKKKVKKDSRLIEE